MELMNKKALLAEASRADFRPEIFEKVINMLKLLEKIIADSTFQDRLVLKGGTALNLFYHNMSRLSVDIDFNYIAEVDRKAMLTDRSRLEAELMALCRREGLFIKRSATEHAGGKWILGYKSVLDQGGNIEIDISYMYRLPLWPIQYRDSSEIGSWRIKQVPVLDVHELAAGKLKALCSRKASRDLFDVCQLLNMKLDPEKLRLAFVVYGAMDRKDWRTISIGDIGYDLIDLEGKLLRVLQNKVATSILSKESWGEQMIQKSCLLFEKLLPFRDYEIEFLTRIIEYGEVKSELLTQDISLQDKIARHPGLAWKTKNVRQYLQAKSP